MMTAGFWFVGMLFCLFGAVLFVVLAFFGIRYLLDYTAPDHAADRDWRRPPAYEDIDA